jgi:hypothetical protein
MDFVNQPPVSVKLLTADPQPRTAVFGGLYLFGNNAITQALWLEMFTFMHCTQASAATAVHAFARPMNRISCRRVSYVRAITVMFPKLHHSAANVLANATTASRGTFGADGDDNGIP